MDSPLCSPYFYRELVSRDPISRQVIGWQFLAGMEMQGIKGAKFQEEMTVLTSTLKSKYPFCLLVSESGSPGVIWVSDIINRTSLNRITADPTSFSGSRP